MIQAVRVSFKCDSVVWGLKDVQFQVTSVMSEFRMKDPNTDKKQK